MENDNQPEKPRKAGAVKTAVLVLGVLAVGTVMSLSGRESPNQCGCLPPSTESGKHDSQEPAMRGARPRLLDLGATTCIPCKKMAPILEELKTEYEGRLDVEFVDVWRMPGVANRYGVQSIPTQIFFDASGNEVYRHQGFFAKEEILRKWDELGIDFKK
jgi:thiol-disulfide isomerase/thioredoxin